MESITAATQDRSASCGGIETEFQQHFGEEELHSMMSVVVPPSDTTGSSFTALLELPPNQAMELLVHSPERAANHAIALSGVPFHPPPQLIFPSDAALIDRASKFSPIVNSEENRRGNFLETLKQEPVESDSNPNSSSSPVVSNPTTDQNPKSTKRKEREKKGKESSKKSKKSANDTSADYEGEKLPYVHVRARRGQATDSHSLAERARREKINARMKLLQKLVPGCNKISGTAMVLDEIINHVQALQRQVEFLSMRLAAVNPRSDFNFDTLLVAESGSAVESNYQDMVMPLIWPEGQVNESRQPYQQQQWQLDGLHVPVWNNRAEDNSNFITPENSLLSYDSSANSASLRSQIS